MNRAIEISPDYAYAYFLRGCIYLWQGESERARADFAQSWQLNARSIKAGWFMKWSSMNHEKPDAEQIRLLEEMARIDPEDYWSLACRGVARWLENRFEEAQALLEPAIALEPAIPDAYFWKGMICASLGEETKAVEAIEEALRLGLPPLLLKPLHWLAPDRPDFYHKHAVKLLKRYKLQ